MGLKRHLSLFVRIGVCWQMSNFTHGLLPLFSRVRENKERVETVLIFEVSQLYRTKDWTETEDLFLEVGTVSLNNRTNIVSLRLVGHLSRIIIRPTHLILVEDIASAKT